MDMGPRRVDGFVRPQQPSGSRPPTPTAASVQQPAPRPVAPQQPAVRPAQPSSPQTQPVPAAEAPSGRKGTGWQTVLQFVAGLLVIAGVAAAVVWLYIRYYQP